MKRLGIALMGAVFGLSGVLLAAPAQAYPDIIVTISDITVVGGNKIVINAKTDPAVNCSWVLTYHAKTGDETVTGSGPAIHHVFNTRKVTHIVHESATASCTYDDSAPIAAGSLGASSVGAASTAVVPAALRTVFATGAVTLLPRHHGKSDGDGKDHGNGHDDDDDGGNGHLPNTGGERLLWLILAVLLLVGGGVTVASARNGNAESNES